MIPIPASDKPLVVAPVANWHVVVIVLLAATLAFIAMLLARHETPATGSASALQVAGTALVTVRGEGRAEAGRGYVFAAQSAQGLAVASTPRDFAPVDAKHYVAATLAMNVGRDDTQILLGWLDPNGRQRVLEVKAAGGALQGTIDLVREPEWTGSIRGLTVVVQGPVTAPLTLTQIELVPASRTETARRMVAEWLTFESWHGGSINYIYGGHSTFASPMPVFAALITALASLLYWGFCRGWAKIGNGWHWAVIVIVPWLLLDLRWVANFGRQLDATAMLFAGKTADEKRLTDDREFFAFIAVARDKIPVTARVFMFADEEYHRVKGGYLLRPRNSLNIAKDPALLPPDTFAPGEYLVLYRKRNVRYSPRDFELRYGDAATLPVELVALQAGNGVFRVLTRDAARQRAAALGASQPVTPQQPVNPAAAPAANSPTKGG
jgi:hypothetical protein